MITGMTMVLSILVGVFIVIAIVFTMVAVAFAVWHQRSLREMDPPTSSHLQSVRPLNRTF